jgi:iron complex outermembrane receptor protein
LLAKRSTEDARAHRVVAGTGSHKKPGGCQMSHDRSSSRLSHRALAGAVSAAVAGTATPLLAQENPQGLDEVIVSARKRDENIQDIPQAVMAFSAEDIAKQGIRSLEDVARFSPSLTVVSFSPGLSKIVFRGLAETVRPYLADSPAAIYLDEQPLTTGAQTPEVRSVDIERIETLAGPQGTLYGASSQSGTVRYIVNKPDPREFEFNVGGGLHRVDEGGDGWDADATLNIPIIKDKLAVRVVGFGATDAGFIDNVLGTTPGRVDNYGAPRNQSVWVHGTKTNADIADDDFNDADWAGGRIAVKWFINDTWSVTGIHNKHESDVHGFNDYDPTMGDLETVKFVEEAWEDSWSNYQFTIDGDFSWAKLTSSTSYFERDTAYLFDAAAGVAYYHTVLGVYGRGTCGSDPATAYLNIYDFATACELNGSGVDVDDADPTGFFRNDQKDKRWTHETRLSGSTSKLDWTLGFFYQDADQHWEYGTYVDGLTRTEAWQAFLATYGPLEPTDIRWGSGEWNTRKDNAIFGEGTWSLSDHWKLLFGARWYKAEMERKYHENVPATAPGIVVEVDGDDDGVLPKIGVQYVIDDERMVYLLYSEGFRLGGVNRDRAQQRGLEPTFPRTFDPDVLENWEAGIKARWFDARLQTNLTAYHQVWADMQLELSDPQGGEQFDTDGDGVFDTRYPYQRVIANLGDAEVDGFDLDLSAAFGNWSAGVVSTYLFKAELSDDIRIENPNPPYNRTFHLNQGARLPLAADLSASAYVEYDWRMAWLGGGDGYVRLQYHFTGGSWNRINDNDGCHNVVCKDLDGSPLDVPYGYGGRVRQPNYATWDLRAGYTTDQWELSAYVDNLFDDRAVIFHSTGAEVLWRRDSISTSSPRTAGLGVRWYFQ